MDWREFVDDPGVLEVVEAARAAGARFYPLGSTLLADDLESWLLLRAVVIARWWATTPDAQDGSRDHFRRVLYKALVAEVKRGRHIADLYGRPESGRQANLDPVALDAPLDGDGLTLAGTLLDERADPLRVVLLRERLEHLLEEAPTAVKVDDGLCGEAMCGRPVGYGGLCTLHYNRETRARLGTCSVEGCEGNVRARGLCTRHWHAALAESRPPCVECGEPARTKGMCNKHYLAARNAARKGKA